jgi:hypothetical protein
MDDTPQHISAPTTMVLRRDGGAWKLVLFRHREHPLDRRIHLRLSAHQRPRSAMTRRAAELDSIQTAATLRARATHAVAPFCS